MEKEFNNLNVKFSIILNSVVGLQKWSAGGSHVCGDLIQLNGDTDDCV